MKHKILSLLSIVALAGCVSQRELNTANALAASASFSSKSTVSSLDGYTGVFYIEQEETLREYLLGRRVLDVMVLIRTSTFASGRYTRNGTGHAYPIDVQVGRFVGTIPSQGVRMADPNPAMTPRIAGGQPTEQEIIDYARTILLQTACQGGRVTENRDLGERYSRPEDLARILAANGGTVRGILQNKIIPDGLQGTPIPIVERDKRGFSEWTVRLRCSLWRSS